ncbi:4-(cytidine 5'-diphospho)-2-C-methyl-D-erythritol kinase [soil metagenome]
MIIFPNAKLNLGLNILRKRLDGFHDLESCFYPVSWCDALEVLPGEEVTIGLSGIPVPGDPDTNLCLKAYHLLRQDHALPPVRLHLHKVIPIGAGLGGGSADGAFALKMLNTLFSLHLSDDELEEYARSLGSDCAFFIRNKPVYALIKGDVFEPVSVDLSGQVCAIVYPRIHITTAEAYRQVKPLEPTSDLKESLQQGIRTWKDTVKNDFEAALFPRYPILREIKEQLYAEGALYASLTGSGSAVYGIFAKEAEPRLSFPGPYLVWQGVL